MGEFFDWPSQPADPCEAIPADACSVNYCPETPCKYDNVEVGVRPNISIRLDADEDNGLAGCVGELEKKSTVNFPAIGVATPTTYELKDGSVLHPINLPLQESENIIRPLIMDENGVIKGYVPHEEIGRRKVVAEDGSIFSELDVLPAKFANNLQEDDEPTWYLGANRLRKICDEGTSSLIQLLKISY